MYVNKNVNPKKKKTGDCVVRAITEASKRPYSEIADMLYENMKKTGHFMNCKENYEPIIEKLGFKKGKVDLTNGKKRPTVQELSKQYPVVIVRVAHHMTTCVGGDIYDIWDCSDKPAYGFWYKEAI